MLKKEEGFISQGTIGGKIKKIREYRGLTQKQLGLRCGFPERSASVRIGQYEKNQKVPREKALKSLALALEIDESALFDTDLLLETRAQHALFDIEDFHSLHPVCIDGHYYLDFGGTTVYGAEIEYQKGASFLKEWLKAKERFQINASDSVEDIAEKKRKYDLWRFSYPTNEAKKTSNRLALKMKQERLEQELEDVKKKLEDNKR